MPNSPQPKFVFFRHTPLTLVERPPLTSSLQSFESCLFLTAVGRFPHSFVSCVTAVESALKAGLSIPGGDGIRLQELLSRARQEAPAIAAIPEESLERLRRTRNRVVHYGFTPQDDEATAALTLEVGIPLLDASYRGFFEFPLIDALVIEIGEHLKAALATFERLRAQDRTQSAGCFAALGHRIRLGMRGAAASIADDGAAERADVLACDGRLWKRESVNSRALLGHRTCSTARFV